MVVDNSFANSMYQTNGATTAMKAQPDGKVIISTCVTNKIFRLNQDGSLDQSFGSSSVCAKKIDLQSSGKIMVFSNNALYRLNVDGSMDNSFTTNYAQSQLGDFAIQSDDKILVVGEKYGNYKSIVRLNANGVIDTTFNINGVGIDSLKEIFAVEVLPNKNIVIAGDFTTYNGNSVTNPMIMLDSTGKFLFQFQALGNYPAVPRQIFDLIYLNSNHIVSEVWSNQGNTVVMFKYNMDGTLNHILPVNDPFNRIEGDLYISNSDSSFYSCNTKLERYESNGHKDKSFLLQVPFSEISYAAKLPNGGFIVASDTFVSGITKTRLVKIIPKYTMEISYPVGKLCSGPQQVPVSFHVSGFQPNQVFVQLIREIVWVNQQNNFNSNTVTLPVSLFNISDTVGILYVDMPDGVGWDTAQRYALRASAYNTNQYGPYAISRTKGYPLNFIPLGIGTSSITVSNPTVCVNSNDTISAYATLSEKYPGLSYTWSTGANGLQSPIIQSGTYSITASYPGCLPQVTSFPLTVNPIANCGGVLEVIADTSIDYFSGDTIDVKIRVRNADNLFSIFSKLSFNSNYLNPVSYIDYNFLGTSVITQPPIITGGTIDFGVSKTSGQSGTNGDGDFFAFKFLIKALPDTNITKFNLTNPNHYDAKFNLSGTTVYDATGAAKNMLTINDTTKLRYYVPVWPGDLNNDKHVNVADILPIGYFYNKTGRPRQNAALQWIAQPAQLWGYSVATNYSDAYRVFADGTGNGIIDLADQSAIGFNLGKVHGLSKPFLGQHEARSGNPPLAAEITETQIDSTQFPYSFQVNIKVGESGMPVDSVLGVAFDLQFDPECVDTNDITFSYSNVLGVLNTSYIKIEDYSGRRLGRIGIGVTRFNTNSLTLSGDAIVTATFKLTSGCNDGWFNITPIYLACTNDYGAYKPLDTYGDSVKVIAEQTVSSIASQHNTTVWSVYPNPSSAVYYINTAMPLTGSIVVTNMLGEIVYQTQLQHQTSAVIDLSNSAAGSYFLQLKTGSEVLTKHIVLNK